MNNKDIDRGVSRMDVSRHTILRRMEAEMTKAKESVDQRESFLRHIAHVQLLCELLLDESPSAAKDVSKTTEPTAEEIAWMTKGTKPQTETSEVKHDPKSIFDF